MSNCAIITEIECDILGRINAFSMLLMVRMTHFDLLS